jgi:hypothetical protein
MGTPGSPKLLLMPVLDFTKGYKNAMPLYRPGSEGHMRGPQTIKREDLWTYLLHHLVQWLRQSTCAGERERISV